jgi:hypothetical protein
MKILIGTEDIAGWIPNYKIGFQKNGHEVTTAVFNHNPFYNHSFDIIISETYLNKLIQTKFNKRKYVRRIIQRVNNKWVLYKYHNFVRKMIDKHDVIIYIWRSFMDDCSDLKYAKSKNKKIVTLFVGSDVRYMSAFKQQFNVTNWTFPKEMDHNNPEWILKWIRNAEKYSDIIYSVPDQAGLQLRPYYHIQVPLLCEKCTYNPEENKILKVLHAPSAPNKKGTDIIESTLDRLKNEGLRFDFVSVRNLPHQEVLDLLSNSDILIDELVFHGPGGISFEAMLSGCAVATRYIESSPAVFRPPIWSIDAESIYEKLKILLTDSHLRRELASKGREYACTNNAVEHVVYEILQNLETPRPPDYIPTFLIERFEPLSLIEIQTINEWTNLVKDCSWYQDKIAHVERSGLNF